MITILTIRKSLEAHLGNLMLFPDHVSAIMTKFEEDTPEMNGRLDDLVTDYPQFLINALTVSVNSTALAYLEEVHPRHFIIPFLRGEVVA